MALIKEIETDKGPASFWVIALLQLDNFNKMGFIRMYGFFNKTYADKNEGRPVHTIELTINPEIYDLYFNPKHLSAKGISPHQQAYEMIKRSTIDDAGLSIDFTDAEDYLGD